MIDTIINYIGTVAACGLILFILVEIVKTK